MAGLSWARQHWALVLMAGRCKRLPRAAAAAAPRSCLASRPPVEVLAYWASRLASRPKVQRQRVHDIDDLAVCQLGIGSKSWQAHPYGRPSYPECLERPTFVFMRGVAEILGDPQSDGLSYHEGHKTIKAQQLDAKSQYQPYTRGPSIIQAPQCIRETSSRRWR